MTSEHTGFTLIELLIVIGVLAVLSVVTVLVLNPAQLFSQARDSQRLSDLNSVKGAIVFYLATVSSPNLQAGGSFTCGTNWGGSNINASSSFSGANTRFNLNLAHAGVRAVDGTGWVAVPLGSVVGGAPLATLPKDPIDNATYSYGYSCNQANLTFELDANMESTRYANGGADDKESTDGGDQADEYETGTALNL